MNKEILIQVDAEETAVAVLEDNRLMEIYFERLNSQRIVGNIYKGRVANVLPGMQAAFVDIGLEKNAFLFIDDTTGIESVTGEQVNHARRRISEVVHEGQEIIVQVVKEPQGSKGARVTTQITLPGRYLVLMPMANYIGVSRRINNDEERERLKTLAQKVKPENMGLIVRTAANGASEEELLKDVNALVNTWHDIDQLAVKSKAPRLIHHDVELFLRILRDLYTDDVSKLVVNSSTIYTKVIKVLADKAYDLRKRVALKEEDLFNLYGIHNQIEQALKRKVWLKCGGYLVIDQMEALTAIDVNTGKYVGRHNLADTVLTTNLEAAVEVARQLRLRNIGGIILIDFIDMDSIEHQEQVLKTLEEELSRDKTKNQVLGFTRLGLVEMTRKKAHQGIERVLLQDCPYCNGTGKVLSEETVALQAKKDILQLAHTSNAEVILVEANPSVAAYLIGTGGANLRILERRTNKKLIIKGNDDFHLEEVKLRELFEQEEVKNLSTPVKVGQVLEVTIEEPHAINGIDGIARIAGFVLDIPNGASFLGKKVLVEVVKVFRTYAQARLLANA
ncbi:MAG: ribonuclease [Clostridia bacterium]|nr:ribonuclease [Clostridia bacterium]